MRKRSFWVRTPLFVLTLLQLSVPGAVAWADGRLGEPSGPAHIESHSTSACVKVHPADCAFHRFLSAPLARTLVAVVRIRDGRGITWAPSVPERSNAVTHLRLPGSRAPPPLS